MATRKQKSTSTTKTKTSEPAFKSKFEAEVARLLRMQGAAYTYEGKRLKYAVLRDYKPDFELENGIFVETKGWFKSDDQRKMRAVKEQHPDKDIRMVFQRLEGRVQGSKMTNAEWCDKYGFKYAEGRIPKAWINEQAK